MPFTIETWYRTEGINCFTICCTMDNLPETEEDNCIVAKTVGCNHSFWLAKFGDSAAAWLLLATKGFFSFDGQLTNTSHHSAHTQSLMLSSWLLSSTVLAYHQECATKPQHALKCDITASDCAQTTHINRYIQWQPLQPEDCATGPSTGNKRLHKCML